MVHVVERAEGRRPQFQNRHLGAKLGRHLVQHRLPARQRLIREPLDDIGEGDVKSIGVMIGMAIAEKIGQRIAPFPHRLAVRLSCAVDQKAARPRLYHRHLERIAHGEGLQPLPHDFGHLVDRRIERKIRGPIRPCAAIFDDALEQRHMQAGNRREGELPGFRHRQVLLPCRYHRTLGLRALRHMADDRIAGLMLEDAGEIVARAEMARRLRMQALRILQ